MDTALRIGELARHTGCPVETIRYYEHHGLLPAPTRSKGNYRLYDATLVEQLTFIRHCRSLDMALEEIRILLHFRDAPEENCETVNQLLDAHIGHVAARIDDLKRLDKQLRTLRRQCGTKRQAKDCGILDGLARPVASGSRGRKKGANHIPGTH